MMLLSHFSGIYSQWKTYSKKEIFHFRESWFLQSGRPRLVLNSDFSDPNFVQKLKKIVSAPPIRAKKLTSSIIIMGSKT